MKEYNFRYGLYEAEVRFIIDINKFTVKHAREVLEFFIWDYDVHADPIDEVMIKYAIQVIKIASFNDYNVFGVQEEFENKEGFYKLDGSNGITLISVENYEFDETNLHEI